MMTKLYDQRNLASGFWRTYNGQEVDLVEQGAGKLSGYEMKWQQPKAIKPPPAWSKDYPHASYTLIHRDNYLPFITTT